ncbi:hypothetical protein [Streptomyces sp. DSM 118878]
MENKSTKQYSDEYKRDVAKVVRPSGRAATAVVRVSGANGNTGPAVPAEGTSVGSAADRITVRPGPAIGLAGRGTRLGSTEMCR